MKVCISCSLIFPDEVLAVKEKLEKLGHIVVVPDGIANRAIEKADFDAVTAKADDGYDSMCAHFAKIRESDALLVCNFTKKASKTTLAPTLFLKWATPTH